MLSCASIALSAYTALTVPMPTAPSVPSQDTENHALRVVDLKTKAVLTLAGTGVKGAAENASRPLVADV